mgnify:CR=1 FL=1
MGPKSDPQGTMRVEQCIACTDIPVRHFYAMIKKDAIGWRRQWKRAMFEIIFPSIVILMLGIVRLRVKPERADSYWHLDGHLTFVGPWSTPYHTGLTKDKTPAEGMYNDEISN